MLGRCTRFLTSKSVLGTAQRTATNISGRRADLRFDTEYDQITIKGRGDSAKFLNASHFVQRFPGSRFVELMKPNEGNPLSYEVMQKLTHEFLQLEQNHAVNVVFFGTNIDYGNVFSTGFCEKALKIDRSRTLKELYTLCRVFETFKGEFATVLGGQMPGTVLGLLLNAKYRLGAPSLECKVDELSRGYLPSGGMAYHFSHKAGVAGLMMSRYLAYSQRIIQGADLYSMDLLTHLVQENPHFTFCNALGHSIGSSSQTYQQLPAAEGSVQALLNAMHVGDDDDLEDPLEDPYWDQIMLIKTDKISMEKCKHHTSDIENFYDEIAACFNAPTLEEAVSRVVGAAPQELYPPVPFDTERGPDFVDTYHWTAEALLSLDKCDPLAAKAWYKLTELTANPKISLKDALKLELHVNTGLMKGRRARMGQLETVDRGTGPSDRSAVKANIEARLATASSADVDALFKNSPVELPKVDSDRILA